MASPLTIAWWRQWWNSLIQTTQVNTEPLVNEPIRYLYPDACFETYDKLYKTQPHVQTVVNFIAVNLGQVGVKVFRRVSQNDRVEVYSHPLAVLLRQPNAMTTRYRFIAEMVTDFCVDGHAYAVKVRPPGGGLELYRVAPSTIQEVDALLPLGFWWTPTGLNGQRRFLEARDVFHLQQPRGQSPLEALRKLLAEEAAATDYRSGFWRNAARLGGVIQRPAGAPRWTPEQRGLFRKQWRRYQGPAGAGKTVVLEDGMSYKEVSATAEQSQLVQSRRLSREEVAAAYHVPPAMVGIVEAQGYGSLREQHKALYQDTLGPYFAMLEGDIQLQLLSEFSDDENIYVEFNIAEKMQGAFEETATGLAQSTGAAFMSVNEARARLNLPRLPDPIYDEPVVRLDTSGGQQQKGRAALPAPTTGAR
jgi:HK97 family phage portal protein